MTMVTVKAQKKAIETLAVNIGGKAESISRAIDFRYGTIGGYPESEIKKIYLSMLSIKKRLDKMRENL